jgi:hypothetical protein
MVLFFPVRLDEARLKQALARVLNDFPLYAGKLRLTGTNLTVEHGVCPVQFETVQSTVGLEHLMAEVRAGRTRAVEPSLSRLKITLTREVTLAVRLTEAREGCALSMVWNHAVGDMHSTMLLMRAWEAAYAGRPYETPIMVADRDAYLREVMPDPVAARSALSRGSYLQAFAQRWALMQPATRVNLEYSTAQLRTLREALSQNKRVTTNDAVCAHVFGAVRRLAGATDPTNLCLVVNFRKRLGLSDRLLGNMTSLLDQPVDEIDSSAQTAASIRDALDHYTARHSNYQATMRVVDVNLRPVDRLRVVTRQYKPGTGDMMVTSWANFGAYDLCFGTARPQLFYPLILGAARLPPWVTIVYELPAARGLGLMLALPPALAQRCLSAEGQALLHRVERTSELAPRTEWYRPESCTTVAAAP